MLQDNTFDGVGLFIQDMEQSVLCQKDQTRDLSFSNDPTQRMCVDDVTSTRFLLVKFKYRTLLGTSVFSQVGVSLERGGLR
jgi:hypothetical protein